MRPAPNAPAFSDALPAGRWQPDNHRRLNAWLHAQPAGDSPRIAVFDWDNTCVFNDIGDATWRYQLDHLRLHLGPDAMRARLPETINGVAVLGNGVPLAHLVQDIMEAYLHLWPHMQGDTVHTVLASEAHRDFRAKMMHLITAIERTPALGPQVSYRAQATFLDGLAPADMLQLARDTWRATRAEAVGSASWGSATPGRAGHVQQSFFTHIALFDEMMDLIRAMKAAGIAPYIVTASCESVVTSLIAALALPITPEHIFGMRPALAPESYPLTYRAGKARVIREHLPAAPEFVAGDADTDFEMLTQFPETRLRLIINRNMQGDIRTLYEVGATDKSPVSTLLQGRNENLACFIPDHRTVPFGHHQPVEI